MKMSPQFLVPTLIATTVAAAIATLSWYFGSKCWQPKPLGATTAA